jgi:hypothetical protein
MSDRDRIRRKIFALRMSIGAELAYGDPEKANQLRDQIGDLERQIQQIDKREREAREERGRQ